MGLFFSRRRRQLHAVPAGAGSGVSFGAVVLAALAAVVLAAAAVGAANLRDFSSDGCSLFPEGSMGKPDQWCECCFAHDIAYWRGGTETDRLQADEALRVCVLERTGNRPLAELMFQGVRAGGHPAFPAWYRWGYGWSYGRGYKALSEEEQALAREKLEAYTIRKPFGPCGGK